MKIVAKEDITLNVLHALKLDEKRKIHLLNNYVIKPLRPFFIKFAGMEGSSIKDSFAKKTTLYYAYHLKKE